MEAGDWITLAAVVVALGIGVASILHTQSLQRKERRERLLNEIIEWALDSAKPKYAMDITSLDYNLSEKDQKTIIQLSQASYTQMLIARGEYIGKIALTLTHKLSTAVENLRNDLENHSQLIDDWIKANKVDAKEIGRHDYVVDQSANKVLKEAAELKTQNLS